MIPFEDSKTVEIVYLEADINYTIFHFNNGRKSISSSTLKKNASNENMQHFLRIHKSFLLNPNYIIGMQRVGKKVSIQMIDGRIIQVSRRRKPVIRHLRNQVFTNINC